MAFSLKTKVSIQIIEEETGHFNLVNIYFYKNIHISQMTTRDSQLLDEFQKARIINQNLNS